MGQEQAGYDEIKKSTVKNAGAFFEWRISEELLTGGIGAQTIPWKRYMLCNGFVPAESESAEDYFRPVRAAGNHMRRELAGTKKYAKNLVESIDFLG